MADRRTAEVREGLRRATVEHEAVHLLGLTVEQARYLTAQWYPVPLPGDQK